MQKRRLARVREPDERRVGEQLQPQLDDGLVPGQTDLGEPRRLAGRARETAIAPPARAATRQHDARARAREIGDEPVLLEDLRPGGNAELDALAGRAVLARAAPGAAALRLDPLAPPENREVAQIRVRDEDDVPARPAVAAVGAAFRDVLLPPEAERTVAAAPGLDPETRTIVEQALTRSR